MKKTTKTIEHQIRTLFITGLAVIGLSASALAADIHVAINGSDAAPGTAAALAEETSSSGRWVVWSGQPAASWQDAFVTGNGRHGTMVMGQPGDERIICVHEELFVRAWDREKVAVADIAKLLPEVRRLMDEGKTDAAAKMAATEARRQLAAMGASQMWPLSPQTRETPYHRPHSTEVLGLSSIPGGDDRYLNNLTTQPDAFDAVKQFKNMVVEGNHPVSSAKIIEKDDGVYLSFELPEMEPTQPVTTERLGKTLVSQAAFENPAGSPMTIASDYFGKPRDPANPGAGPFAGLKPGRHEIKVWPK